MANLLSSCIFGGLTCFSGSDGKESNRADVMAVTPSLSNMASFPLVFPPLPQAALSDKLLTRASAQGRNRMAEVWARKKEETNRQRDVIQKTINRSDEIAFASMTQSEIED